MYTGLSKDAAEYIVEAGNVFGVGVDTPSLDPGKVVTFEAHQTLSEAQIFGIENLNLGNDTLPGNLCTHGRM
jgi:kynurenine formamidase